MYNHIHIMGRLVADPTLRQTGNGINVCSFRIACDRDNPTENGPKADFFDCVAWRKTGEFVSKYFMKGKPILISGRLQIREWPDKEGQLRRTPEIRVDEVEFCGGEKKQMAASAPAPASAQSAPPVFDEMPEVGDDLPWKDDGFEDIAGLPV